MRPPRRVAGLRRRLLLTLVPLLTLVLAANTLFEYRLVRETADRAYDHSLADAGLDIAAHIQRSGQADRVTLSAEAEAMLRSDPSERIFFAVRAEGGRLLAGDGDLADPGPADTGRLLFTDSQFRDQAVRLARYRFDVDGQRLTVLVAETVHTRAAARQTTIAAMLASSVGILVATLLAVYIGVRLGLGPLRQVEAQIGARTADDLREIDLDIAPDELRPLLSRLNHLFGLLRAAAAAQTRFLADAAHQLRTPLTGLQTQLELAQIDGLFAGHAERRVQIEASTDRIAHLVRQLLSYARAEPAGAVTQVFEAVALADLLEDAASAFLDRALARGIDLGFEITPATVRGVPWMLRELLGNLLDNALRYTPTGGVVTVRSIPGTADDGAHVEVEDNGPGIPVGERSRVFDRFVRLPGAGGDGCGLGLAIVREIAALHGLRVRLLDAPGGGLIVRLDFPPPAAGSQAGPTLPMLPQ